MHKRANRHCRLIKIGFQRIKTNVREGEKTTITTVELDLDRMEKMKRQVLKTIQRMVDEYGNVSVIELELALIEGLAKVREIGMKQTQEEDESVV
jgi:hypothetical protein